MLAHVFVYGTLLPGQANHPVVKPFVRAAVPARLAGFTLWTCGAFPGARPAADGVVEGMVLTLAGGPEALDRLDVLEGVPDLYERRRVSVSTANEPLDVWAYVLAVQDLRGWRPLGPRWVEGAR